MSKAAKARELELLGPWFDAVQVHTDDAAAALSTLQGIEAPNAKILFNIGHIAYTLKQFAEAQKALSASIAKDKYSAVAYFCRGTVRFKLKQYSDALSDFEATNEQLNDNVLIDYKQLNFKFKLCKCEVLYNIALTLTSLGQKAGAESFLKRAANTSYHVKDTHEELATQNTTNPLFLVDSTQLFTPAKSKVANMKGSIRVKKSQVINNITGDTQVKGFAQTSTAVLQQKQADFKTEQRKAGGPPPRPSPPPRSQSATEGTAVKRSPPSSAATVAPPVPPPPGAKPGKPHDGGSGKVAKGIKDVTKSIGSVIMGAYQGKPKSDVGATTGGSAATPKRASAEVKKTAKQPPAAARSPSIPSGTTPSGVGIGELTQTLQGLRAPTHLVPTPSPKVAARSPAPTTVVKVHYRDTRRIRVSTSATISDLKTLLMRKFSKLSNSSTLWHKDGTAFSKLHQAKFNEMIQGDPARCVLWVESGSQAPGARSIFTNSSSMA